MGFDPNAKMDVRMNRQERLEIFKDALRSPDLEAFGFKSFSAKKTAYSSLSKLAFVQSLVVTGSIIGASAALSIIARSERRMARPSAST
jgi:hypothetical protein